VQLEASRDLQTLWNQAARLSDVEFAAFIAEAFPELLDPFIALSADLAATWFEQSEPASRYIAVTAPPPPTERFHESALWALRGLGTEGLDRLQGVAQRAIFDGARDTTLINVERTNSRWARYASANACAFCQLLSTRTKNLYSSEEAATRVVGRRGSRKVGDKYHDHCHCVAVEVREGQTYELPPHAEQFEETYKSALDAIPDGTEDYAQALLSQWRQISGAR